MVPITYSRKYHKYIFSDWSRIAGLWLVERCEIISCALGTCFFMMCIRSLHFWIRDFRMSRMSGIEISSSQGLKKPPKISPRDVKLTLPRAVGPREVSFSSHGLILRFFSTRGMKKFLYLTSTAIRKTYSCLSLYMWKICFFREIVMGTRYPGGNWKGIEICQRPSHI